MDLGFTTLTSYKAFLPFISLIFSIATVIIGLNIIWRTEKDLDRFMKWLTIAVTLVVARKLLGLMGLAEADNWSLILVCFDLVISLAFLIAFVKMYKIVRLLDREKK